jgi:hypothetical protein
MIEIKITVEGPPVGPQLDARLERIKLRIQRAIGNASGKLADNILTAGRADITGAGRFGARWTQGLTSGIAGEGLIRTITIREAVPYWRVFQYGAIIHGKPLLWIPLSFAGIPPGTRARDFRGRLFRVDRKGGGAPLLLSADDKKPKYFGAKSVRIPKKFHLVEIARAEANTFGALYRVEMATE